MKLAIFRKKPSAAEIREQIATEQTRLAQLNASQAALALDAVSDEAAALEVRTLKDRAAEVSQRIMSLEAALVAAVAEEQEAAEQAARKRAAEDQKRLDSIRRSMAEEVAKFDAAMSRAAASHQNITRLANEANGIDTGIGDLIMRRLRTGALGRVVRYYLPIVKIEGLADNAHCRTLAAELGMEETNAAA